MRTAGLALAAMALTCGGAFAMAGGGGGVTHDGTMLRVDVPEAFPESGDLVRIRHRPSAPPGERLKVFSAGVRGDFAVAGECDAIIEPPKTDENDALCPVARRIVIDATDAESFIELPRKGGYRIGVVNGKRGFDDLFGGRGRDRLRGGGFKDDLDGGRGNDVLVGGPRADNLFGGRGNDVLRARDGGRDKEIDCGQGKRDRAVIDRGDDSAPVDCETVTRR